MAPTYRDRAVVVDDTLIVADLHVGKSASANLELPLGDGSEQVERLRDLLAATDPDRLVVAGDFLHSFSTIPRTVQGALDGVADLCANAGVDVVVTPGNHDTMLDSVWDGATEREIQIGDTVVCHGHDAPEADAERYVVGHDHPTVEIEGQRRPCYLVGEDVYRGADVVMLPSFNRMVRGVTVGDMRARDFRSPLVTDPDAFRPFVLQDDGEVLEFPPLGEFRRMLG